MKITGKIDPDSDLLQKPISRKQVNRKSRNPGFAGGGVRLKREGVPAVGKRGSRPETPLLRWKFDKAKEEKSSDDDRISSRQARKGRDVTDVSVRKLAAGLWRLQPPEVHVNGGELCSVAKSNRFGFQPTIKHPGIYSPACHTRKSFDSVSGSRNKLEPKYHFSNFAMEGITKWDPDTRSKHVDDEVGIVSMVSVLESELEHARSRIHELETERRASKKKLEQFLKKLNEERGVWRSREHEKIRVVIDDLKGELNRERKNRRRMEAVNSKLVAELAAAKLSGKRYMEDYEKERKGRELLEEVCDELAKEIGEDKAEVEGLKQELMTVDDERKMLQVAEVWREERVQMKLVDVKVALEDKYSQMNKLVKDLEDFLTSKRANLDLNEMKRAKTLRESADLINIQEIMEFSYEPANPDDTFAVFEDFKFRETGPREIEPNYGSKVQGLNPKMAYFDQNGDIVDDDESGWETASHLEDQGSSHSPNASESITEMSEVCSVQSKQAKKGSSISRLWRSSNRNNWIKGRRSNEAVLSPDHSSAKSGVISPSEWGSEDGESGNGHVTRGTKGCTEWAQGAIQKNSLKAKLLEARMESQKVQLRQVLKQKI